jgi:hypothetical protein
MVYDVPMNKNKTIFVGIVLLAIIVILVVISNGKATPGGSSADTSKWETYTDPNLDFSVSYPSEWVHESYLSATSTCCLFIAHWVYGTTTNASGTPQETATELVKLQIGAYKRGGANDPFKTGTTTEVTMNGTKFYTGTAGAMTFYLLPKTDTDGIGAALFPYLDTPAADLDTAKTIVGTMKIVPKAK